MRLWDRRQGRLFGLVEDARSRLRVLCKNVDRRSGQPALLHRARLLVRNVDPLYVARS